MDLRGAIALLLAHDAESDPAFRDEIERLSRAGLRVMGYVGIVCSLFMFIALITLERERVSLANRLPFAGIVLVGTLAIIAARSRHARAIGCAVGFTVACLLMSMSFAKSETVPMSDRYIAAQCAVVLMILLTALPLRPVQALTLGAGITAAYVVLERFFTSSSGVTLIFLVMLTLLSTGLATIIHRRTFATFNAHRTELRAFLSQSAATVGRLAAALSHELNTPVGTLKSTIDTMEQLARRRAVAGAARSHSVAYQALEKELRANARQSTERLEEIVSRMQRVTNLDRAEFQATDLNALVKDVVYLLQSQMQLCRADIDLQLGDLPSVTCRPQQISAVLVSLLERAAEASSNGGTVAVSTAGRGRYVSIMVCDSAPRYTGGSTTMFFDPGFRESDGRIRAGNWSLFAARQIVREHGGDVRVDRSAGSGTMVIVSLPV